MIPFIFGAIIGSFLNVIIIRTPRGLSIISPRSHCVNCKTQIPLYLNIPIISYILIRGRCSFCKENISVQYPIVELLTALIFMVCYSNTSIYEASLLSFVCCVLIIIGFIDLKYFLIPIYLIILLYIALVLKSILINTSNIDLFIGGAGVTLYLSLCSGMIAIKKKSLSVIGMGDIALAFFIGAWLGLIDGFICLFIASIIGIILIMIERKEGINKIPFGLCLAISFLFMSVMQLYGYSFINL